MLLRLPNALVELAGHEKLVESISDELEDLRDDQLHTGPEAEPWTMRLIRRDTDVRIEYWRAGRAERRFVDCPAPGGDVLDAVVGRLNRIALDSDPARLHLHAAGLEMDGSGLVLAGPSGSGKSTVGTELLLRGARYLTDESLTVLGGSRTVFAFPKPITLKRGTREYFRTSSTPLPPQVQSDVAVNGRGHLRASRVAEVAPFTTVSVVVLLRYRPSTPMALRPVSLVEGAVALLSDSLDVARFGPSALSVLTEAMSGAVVWELDYTDAATAAEVIGELRPPLRRTAIATHRGEASVGFMGSGSDPDMVGSGDRVPEASGTDPVRFHRVGSTVVTAGDGGAILTGGKQVLATLDDVEVASFMAGEVISLERTSGRAGGDVEYSSATGAVPSRGPGNLRPSSGEQVLIQKVEDIPGGEAIEERPRRQVEVRTDQETMIRVEMLLSNIWDSVRRRGIRVAVVGELVDCHDGHRPLHEGRFDRIDLLVDRSDLELICDELLALGLLPADPARSEERIRLDDAVAERDPEYEPDSRRFRHASLGIELVVDPIPTAGTPDSESDDTDHPLGELVPFRVHGRWMWTLHPDLRADDRRGTRVGTR